MVEFYVLRLLNKLLHLYFFMGYTKQQLTGIIYSLGMILL